MKIPVLFSVLIGVLSNLAFADVISNPIQDFLTLPIPGHYSDASQVVIIHEANVDLEGNGSSERFVGHHQMWNGGNSIYYSAYKPILGGYERITPSNEDIAIDFYGGDRALIYVGWLDEIGAQGMLIADPILEHVPGGPDYFLPITRFSNSKFYTIEDNKLLVEEHGPVDLRTSKGKVFYDRYFGKGVQSRSITFEDYPVEKLKKAGYTIPDWTKPPEPPKPPTITAATPSASVQASPQPVQQSRPPSSIPTATPTGVTKIPALTSFPIVPVVILAAVLAGAAVFFLRRKQP